MFNINDHIIYCTACEIANHKPSNWWSKIVPAEIQNRIDHDKLLFHQLRALKEINDLNDLKRKSHHIGPKELSTNAQKEGMTQNKDKISKCSTWLLSDLENFIGVNKMLYNINFTKGFTIPYLMKINTETGDFISMNKRPVELNLICNDNELMYVFFSYLFIF